MKKIIIHNHYARDGALTPEQEARYKLLLARYTRLQNQGRSLVPREMQELQALESARRGYGSGKGFGSTDAGAVCIVHNKLLGGWYVVRGSSDTPLSGKFPSKEAAQAWLDQRNSKDARARDGQIEVLN